MWQNHCETISRYNIAFTRKGGSGRLLKPGPLHMIQVTRLNGTEFTLNALYIEKVESFPDTTITLTTGTKYVVLDTADEVNQPDHRIL